MHQNEPSQLLLSFCLLLHIFHLLPFLKECVHYHVLPPVKKKKRFRFACSQTYVLTANIPINVLVKSLFVSANSA